jgi:hypothetical protein
MDELTQAQVQEFIKPGFYLMQNVLTFLLPGRKHQFDFYTNQLETSKKNLSCGTPIRRLQRAVAWRAVLVERAFLTYLLSEEMGTYFDAMVRFPGGDIVGSVLSKDSYTFSHNFYQLAKSKHRDFFSRLMMYPFNDDLRRLYGVMQNAESENLIRKITEASCLFLWEKKERIRKFRERYKSLFNGYKHGMSILYNMKGSVDMSLQSGQRVRAVSNGPLVLDVRLDDRKKIRRDRWSQIDESVLDKSVTECFSLIHELFDSVVRARLESIQALLQAFRYDESTGKYVPVKHPTGKLTFYRIGELSTEELNRLKELFEIKLT